MSQTPKVSVIMPAYNVEDYIGVAIESVLAQTMSDWELVIVDDRSSDSTLEIAREYASKDSRIKVYESESPSGGAYTPRKRGIILASAQVVAPLDADDLIPADYLERMFGEMESRGLDAIYPVNYRFNGRESIPLPGVAEELFSGMISGKEAVKYALDGWRIHCGGGLIKKDVYMTTFPQVVDSEIISHQDEFLTRILLYNCRTVGMSPTPYYYRINPQSVTHKRDLRTFSFLINNSRLVSFIRSHFPVGSEEDIRVQRQNFYGIFNGIRLLDECHLSKEDRRTVKRLLKDCHKKVDYKFLRGKVSPKYYMLFKMPVPVISLILKLVSSFS